MQRPEPDSPEANRRSTAAAEWLVKRDRGLTPVEQDEFFAWLGADPRHGEWLALHRRVVRDFRALAQWRPEHSDEPNPDLLARPARRAWWVVPVTLAAAAAIVVMTAWVRQGMSIEPETAPIVGAAELERRILEDGSTVDLNRGAVVNIAFTPSERRVTLLRGEALFTVTKNAERPFVVRAGGIDVRAVGTAFNVRLDTAEVEVLVTEGKVQVDPPDRSEAPATSSVAPPPLVAAGQRATVAMNRVVPPRIEPVTPAESARLLAWQPQLLDFSSAPLERAIAEFNRRNRIQFVLADPEIGAMPIVASIRSDKVEGFAQFLASTPGVLVERRGEYEIVLRRKP